MTRPDTVSTARSSSRDCAMESSCCSWFSSWSSSCSTIVGDPAEAMAPADSRPSRSSVCAATRHRRRACRTGQGHFGGIAHGDFGESLCSSAPLDRCEKRFRRRSYCRLRHCGCGHPRAVGGIIAGTRPNVFSTRREHDRDGRYLVPYVLVGHGLIVTSRCDSLVTHIGTSVEESHLPAATIGIEPRRPHFSIGRSGTSTLTKPYVLVARSRVLLSRRGGKHILRNAAVLSARPSVGSTSASGAARCSRSKWSSRGPVSGSWSSTRRPQTTPCSGGIIVAGVFVCCPISSSTLLPRRRPTTAGGVISVIIESRTHTRRPAHLACARRACDQLTLMADLVLFVLVLLAAVCSLRDRARRILHPMRPAPRLNRRYHDDNGFHFLGTDAAGHDLSGR